MIKIRKGLDLPIKGRPEQRIEDGPRVSQVALIGDDHVGMKPTMAVREGDWVELGQVLFTDKRNPGVQYTSPGTGQVAAIHRGAKRAFQSIVIRLQGSDEKTFTSFQPGELPKITPQEARDNLIASGLWTTLRTRPFSRVPAVDSTPHSIFVQAIDTQPLAPDPAVVMESRHGDFERGLDILAKVTEGTVWLCRRPGAAIPAGSAPRVEVREFAGPHPAGLAGTHIHKLDPVSDRKTVWSIGYQDVMAIGRLFTTGRLSVERVVALGGPQMRRPRLLRTRIGAGIEELTSDEVEGQDTRLVSGSVLTGRTAEGPLAFLGRFHLQIGALAADRRRPFFGWIAPGFGSFSVKPAFASALVPGKQFALTTSAHGGARAIVPIGMFEKVMPLDLVPTALLKSIMSGDAEKAQELGCLELDEEDLALCSFVDPGKGDFGTELRKVLTIIEKEG